MGVRHRDIERDACGVGFIADLHGRPTHDIVAHALSAVTNLSHRGAVAADGKTGDGAGVLTQLPYGLFRRDLGISIPDADLAVGMCFLPQDPGARSQAVAIIEEAADQCELRLVGWRDVPVNPAALGAHAQTTRPHVAQMILARKTGQPEDAFDRTLYRCRRRIEREASVRDLGLYLPSLSRRTIVYKGLFASPQLASFYPDLVDPIFTTALAVFHQRYSTNTFPSWALSQPFRFLAHNGEINTLQGNVHWMRAREPALSSSRWGEQLHELLPVIQEGGSDSAMLDNVVDLLVASGRDLAHTLLMLVPEAWEGNTELDDAVRAFYEYHTCLTEPWDGPAALAFSDGAIVGAALDRNGLRPARYLVTTDGLVVMASEAGVLDIPPSRIAEKGRLGPGQMMLVDTARKNLLRNAEIKSAYARRRPYRKWVQGMIRPSFATATWISADCSSLVRRQRAFSWTLEDVERILRPMADEGKDPVFSMGDDIPAAVLSGRYRPLYHYFKQRFAQVTNPPIDPLRERLVMSLTTALGPRPSLLEETAAHARLLQLSSPILVPDELRWIRDSGPFTVHTLAARFPVEHGADGFMQALNDLIERACEAAPEAPVLVISDSTVDHRWAPIPMLLAVAAVHHELIRRGLRLRTSLVVETGDAKDIHHLACLLGYGANAVCPYLAFETLAADSNGTGADHRWDGYRRAAEAGLLKIMSKMGISTVQGYVGAQIFEAIGLAHSLVEAHFPGTPSRIGGISLRDLAEETVARHQEAGASSALTEAGYVRFRREGEYHAFNPYVVKALHRAARNGDADAHKKFADLVAARPPTTLRDLLEFAPCDPVSIDNVEPVGAIVRRFVISAMSHGALSLEAHKTLAVAANRIGARSNSGEGGEDPSRYWPASGSDNANSRIKQIASARFGVTPEYVLSADELEIKMAQGSKPGEGGQLPGHKVSAEIAHIRRAQPGMTLISPPPHHDIYSIEDLAQLIYDLKRINPQARVAVKLVAEAGVGTIAAGVAKAFADTIQISGCDGGTGASPLDSIKNAGVPWELGLAETQQVLVENGLRSRVRLRVDGGLKTGRDIVIGAMLGADEFGFGSAAVVALGCVMARQCHLNTCPVGIATQRDDLRLKFSGTPEMVIAYVTSVAEQVREILAALGVRKLEDVIGRIDWLRARPAQQKKVQTLDLSFILRAPDTEDGVPRRNVLPRNDRPVDENLDRQILSDIGEALEEGQSAHLAYPIHNRHRAVGAGVAGAMARLHGDRGLPADSITLEFSGAAGQSFGAFCIPGLTLVLDGEANDYVGKAMAGGAIVIRPPGALAAEAHRHVIIGNTVLYGATGGRMFAAGRAGERFAVRNSGAVGVIEGVGDHACEYMTGGVIVVLGEAGRNFAAGMTGGVAYTLDEQQVLSARYNPEHVQLERLAEPDDEARLLGLIAEHARLTRSRRAAQILTGWEHFGPLFWKVAPRPVQPVPQVPLTPTLPVDTQARG
jgi:glutamate synthase domain-containing protein 2/glutamate synthase domain-containing protein 1/glutamate synthase domain-containing protein 3